MGDATRGQKQVADTRWAALRASLAWLAHPVSLVAIATLALNDHVLKDAYGTWWTGKLSDFAGLVFAPALVAVFLASFLPRVSPKAIAVAAIVSTGLLFAAAKATAVGADLASAAWSAIAGPSVILKDPTDLVALASLGAAWVVWQRAAAHRARGGLSRRLLAAIALPAALVATTATGPTGDPAALGFVQSDGEVYLVLDYPPGHIGVEFESFSSGGTSEYVSWKTGESLKDRWDANMLAVDAEVCVPSDARMCFRAMPDHLGVEASDDGGATWEAEWSVTGADRAHLERLYSLNEGSDLLVTGGLVIVEFESDFKVYAANGQDGLAVRDPSGTWTRLGFEHTKCCSYFPLAPLASDPPLDPFYYLPWFLIVIAAAWPLAFWLLAEVLPAKPDRRWWRYTLGVLVVALGALFVWSSILVNLESAKVLVPPDLITTFTIGMSAGIASLLFFAGVSVLGVLRRGASKPAFVAASGVAAVAGIASALFSTSARTSLTAGAVAFVPAVIASVILVRRRIAWRAANPLPVLAPRTHAELVLEMRLRTGRAGPVALALFGALFAPAIAWGSAVGRIENGSDPATTWAVVIAIGGTLALGIPALAWLWWRRIKRRAYAEFFRPFGPFDPTRAPTVP